MRNFSIILPSPAEPVDAKLQKSYQKFRTEVDALEVRRREAVTEWSRGREVINAMLQRGARDVDLAATRVKMCEIEIAAIERELPVMRRVLDEHLPAALKARRYQSAVLRERVSLAEQAVVAQLHREFDPKRWPYNDAALRAYVAAHPIVRGAQEAASQSGVEPERDAITANQTTATESESALQSLKRSLVEQLELSKRADDAAKALAEKTASDLAKQRERDEANAQHQQRIEADARRQLGL